MSTYSPAIKSGMTALEWEKVSWDVIQGTLRVLSDSASKAGGPNSAEEATFSGYKDGYGDAAHNFNQVKRGEWGSLIERLHQAKKLAGGDYVKEMLTTEYTDAYLTAIRSAIRMAYYETLQFHEMR